MIGTAEFHLSVDEINSLGFGEMIDLINCLSVYRGAAKYKKHAMTYDEVMKLR